MLKDKATKNLGTSSLSSSHKNRSVLVPVSEHSFCTCCIDCLFHLKKKKKSFSLFQNWGNFCFQAIKKCDCSLTSLLYCRFAEHSVYVVIHSGPLQKPLLLTPPPHTPRTTIKTTTHTFGQRGFVPTAVFLQQSLI